MLSGVTESGGTRRSPLAPTPRRPRYANALGFALPRQSWRVIDAYSEACSYRIAQLLRAATKEPNIDRVRGGDGGSDDQFPELLGDAEGER